MGSQSNRFNLLADDESASIVNKRRKSKTINFIQNAVGPTIEESKFLYSINDPKIIRISVADAKINKKNEEEKAETRTLKNINPFIVAGAIKQYTSNIGSFRLNKEGQYLITINSGKVAECICKNLKTIGDMAVEAKICSILNRSKGTIRAPALRELDETTILQGLIQDNPNITAVKHIQKNKANTGTIIVTFNTTILPKDVKIFFENFKVNTWYPSPLRCRNCWEFRHHETECTLPHKLCPDCGQTNNEEHEQHKNVHGKCQNTMCIGCKNNEHTTLDRSCPTYQREREIVKMAIDLKLSRFEARKKWHSEHSTQATNSSRSVKTYAQAATTNAQAEQRVITELQAQIKALQQQLIQLQKDNIQLKIMNQQKQTQQHPPTIAKEKTTISTAAALNTIQHQPLTTLTQKANLNEWQEVVSAKTIKPTQDIIKTDKTRVNKLNARTPGVCEVTF